MLLTTGTYYLITKICPYPVFVLNIVLWTQCCIVLNIVLWAQYCILCIDVQLKSLTVNVNFIVWLTLTSVQHHSFFSCFYLMTKNVPLRCEFEFRSDEVYSIQQYVIKFVSDLQQVGGFLRVLRFPPPIKLTATM
jgi:hypothetical protein